jgi:hypothetical protein
VANNLTGEFDIAAQFSIGAANRLLAAMHRAERFPHLLTLRVDDVPSTEPFHLAVIGSVDALGDATLDPGRLPAKRSPARRQAGTGHRVLDAVVNADLGGANVQPIIPSNLKGRVQLQLSPPTLDVSAGSWDSVTVHIGVIARYFPDPGTRPLAEFVRGTLVITAPFSQSGSAATNVIDIDVGSADAALVFTPSWSSAPLADDDLAAINLLIRNALKTSFLPSNVVVPPRIRQLEFRTFPGSAAGFAMLLNVRDESRTGDPSAASTVFLRDDDEFAIAAGLDLVEAAFAPVLAQLRDQQISQVPVVWTTYSVNVAQAQLVLEPPDRIVLNVRGTAATSSWLPNFDFTVSQVLRLSVSGPAAELEVGALSLTLTNDIADWIVSPIKAAVRDRLVRWRDDAIRKSGAHEKVRRFLNANETLGAFLNSLFVQPMRKPSAIGLVQLAYRSVRVQASGIVLHGSLGVREWPPAHIEFEDIPVRPGPGVGSTDERFEYSAARSWVPGGVVQHYEWHRGDGPHAVDPNRFVLPRGWDVSSESPGRALPAYNPLCLTVSGTRLSASGSVTDQPITMTFRAFHGFPVFTDGAVDIRPTVVLVERDAQDLIRITGEALVDRVDTAGGAPYLVVHFGNCSTAAHLERLVIAVREAGSADGTTAVVAVLEPDQLKRAPFIEGVTYSSTGDAWRMLLKRQGRGPATLLVAPDRGVVWRHEGDIDAGALRQALKEHIGCAAPVSTRIIRCNVRVGHPPPNLLFEYAPGRALPLRKLSGRPAILVFWTASSQASIDAVRDLQPRNASDRNAPLVLAINHGDAPDAAARSAAENGLTAILVTDPAGAISQAYGVTIWPTIIDVDPVGIVRRIRYGYSTALEEVEDHV